MWWFNQSGYSSMGRLSCLKVSRRRPSGATPNPVKDKTIDEVYQEALAQCRPPMAPFDGYSEKILRVSSTCLISYDRNRYMCVY